MSEMVIAPDSIVISTNTMSSDPASIISLSTSNTATSDATASTTSFITNTISTESIGFTVSASSTTGINFMISSSIDVLATSRSPPIDVTQEQNDDGGSDAVGIVAGCVAAFILITVTAM